MGGIKVNNYGETTIQNLYAVGECANTGVHGANRLASNSLLEAVVYAEQLAKSVLTRKKELTEKVKIPIAINNLSTIDLPTVEEIKLVMDRLVGIVRNEKDLQAAVDWFNQFKTIMTEPNHLHLTIEQKTICNMLPVGLIIAKASLIRTESRGGHYRIDYSTTNDSYWLGNRIICTTVSFIARAFDETTNPLQQQSPVKKELSVI
ncbi:FAD-binding protein [Anaerobacillus sp. HL2]|nr:FAD-binding protein [Anaerobacillus sp. HL2]